MNAGRPIEFDPDHALEAAMRLFWRKGYEHSSLQELLDAMQLSKSSFYQAFNSKHALFERCIRRYRERLTKEMKEQLAASRSGRAFVAASLHGVARETTGPQARLGCLLMNTASEFSQRDAVIAELITDSIRSLTDVFEEAVARGQQRGEIASTRDARTLASYLVSSLGGLRNMVKAGADAETVKRIVDVTLSALD